MTSLVSSRERLRDPRSIDLFKRIFVAHGATGLPSGSRDFSEVDRMSIVPLVFGLLPAQSVQRSNRDQLVKPIIRRHLTAIGLQPDDELVTILKEISDQFFLSSSSIAVRRKMKISDLRSSQPREYSNLRTTQNFRCAICGIPLTDTDEHLDHRIPFRLIGDVRTGANWQLLCGACNIGKSHWISALQPSVSQNWAYAGLSGLSLADEGDQVNEYNLTLRFSLLSQRRKCEHPGCSTGPFSGQMHLVRNVESSLPVIDHYMVMCDQHTLHK